jgi:glutathione S-transferase
MQNEKITLYTYATSPYGTKVYWALIYKRLAFHLVYVSPIHQKQIRFTNQKVVPVLRISDKWRLDSTALCRWLDELYPEPALTGRDEQEEAAIREADEWVTHNLIALGFRLMLDKDMRLPAFKAGRKLVKTLRETSGDVPWAMQFAWSTILSRVGFINRDAARTDMSKPFRRVQREIIEELDGKLTNADYIAGTDRPTYADIAAFAQLASATENDMKHLVRASDTPAIQAWFDRMVAAMPERCEPPLVPGRQPEFLTA